ncbi:MAG: TPM domain-containing protein [Firmicutes bacterium]|nr:TPM domain-containing protein [Bacillota bacterium]
MKRLNVRSILALLVALILSVSIFGAMSSSAASVYVVDESGSLSQDQIQELNSKLAEYSKNNQCDVVFVLKQSLNGESAANAADAYFDANVGFGSTNNGIVLLFAIDESEYAFSTGGYAYSVFSDYECNELISQVAPYLKSQDYVNAISTFGSGADYYLQHAGQQAEPTEKKHNPIWAPIAAAVGAIAGWIGTGGQKAALTSVHQQQGAKNYVRSNSLQVVDAREQYLYSQITRVPRQQQQQNPNRPTTTRPSGGGGGGVHGGTSGKI